MEAPEASPPKLSRRPSYTGDLPSPPSQSGGRPLTEKRSQPTADAGAQAGGGAAKRRRATFAEPPATATRTFALSPSESASKASLSCSIKQAVKRARGGDSDAERCPELAVMLPRMRELISAADLSTFSLRDLRETLEAETGCDLSAHKRDVKEEMQRLVCELSGGKLVATPQRRG